MKTVKGKPMTELDGFLMQVILIFASDRGLDLLRRYPKNVRRVSLIECCLLNLIGEIFKIVVRLILLLFYLLCLLTENGQIKMRMNKKRRKSVHLNLYNFTFSVINFVIF
jgi:hypothetical protein